MKTWIAVALCVGALVQGTGKPPLPRVAVDTELGEIVLEVDTIRAPLTAANFLKYVDAGLYDGGRFHRSVRTNPDNQPKNDIKIDVIQAGANPSRTMEYLMPIAHEPTSKTGLTHDDGALSMARAQVNTARDQFFICIGNQRELDYGGKRNADGQGYAAFGRVVAGMEVVRKVHASPASGQTLTPPVRILRVRRIS
jgi:peptidyl-prolyl cis-trans isomerase A (cyclophilin A)